MLFLSVFFFINWYLIHHYYQNSYIFILVQVERERNALISQTFKQLNNHYSRRTNTSGNPLAVHRLKVTFKDEPGEGSGVARSFYTAVANVSIYSFVFCNL